MFRWPWALRKRWISPRLNPHGVVLCITTIAATGTRLWTRLRVKRAIIWPFGTACARPRVSASLLLRVLQASCGRNFLKHHPPSLRLPPHSSPTSLNLRDIEHRALAPRGTCCRPGSVSGSEGDKDPWPPHMQRMPHVVSLFLPGIGRTATRRPTLDHNIVYVAGENLKLRPGHMKVHISFKVCGSIKYLVPSAGNGDSVYAANQVMECVCR
jgi:hypothetical protein